MATVLKIKNNAGDLDTPGNQESVDNRAGILYNQ